MDGSQSASRARWAAVGAALAVSLGAGGFGIARATAPSGASAYVAVSPCRLVDTRSDPTFHVGPHSPLRAGTRIVIDGWGTQGECTHPPLPSGSAGLQLNVTAVGATAPTHLTVYPGGGSPPNASSLNPAPGTPPVPNAVSVQLDGAGRFSVYNLQGSVDVVVDVVGYFTDHRHDIEYVRTETAVNAAFNFVTAIASCPAGMRAIGGGGGHVSGAQPWLLLDSEPTDDGTGWSAWLTTKDGTAAGANSRVSATAVCTP